MANEAWKTIAAREHAVMTARREQLEINIIGLHGGRPYIDARLSRFPAESSSDWDGTKRKDGSVVAGRREQSHCIPYLGRITEKINQHVLGTRPVRTGADEGVLADITLDGESVNQFMRNVNSLVTACGWAWIILDMAPAAPGLISVAVKEATKRRPYWKLYPATAVVDWSIDATGGVRWVLTEETETTGDDPFSPPATVKVRRLWQPGQVTTYYYRAAGDRIVREDVKPLETAPGVPLPVCPAVLVGRIDAKPHRFDDLEGINRTMMDLESANRANFFHCVFPQPYIPASILDTVKQQWEVNAETAISMIFGQGYPILLNKDDPTPGYMMPDAAATGTMRTEIDALRGELFNVVGLMLQQETRQVASAEAKAWDYLDVSHVMRERAQILEDGESKAVSIMVMWDKTVKAWSPKYNRDFDVGGFKDEIESLTKAMGVSMPDELSRFLLGKLFERTRRIGTGAIDTATEKRILQAIAEYAPAAAFEAVPGADGGGGGNAGTAGARAQAVNMLASAVKAGTLSKGSAVVQLKKFLGVTDEEAAAMLDDSGAAV